MYFFFFKDLTCASNSFEQTVKYDRTKKQEIKRTNPQIKLFYWKPDYFENFGDELSYELVKRIVPNLQVTTPQKPTNEKKLLAIGSIIGYAQDGDLIWGSGRLKDSIAKQTAKFDVRAVRGPNTRENLIRVHNISVPEIYGDPALLLPHFFPEYKRKAHPKYEYTVIPHFLEQHLPIFNSKTNPNVIYPTQKWQLVIRRILNSKLVIASAMHGIIVAESFGIPARMLFPKTKEPNYFKYIDYYYGTGRFNFKYATSIDEALKMGGEPPVICDLEKLYAAFPRDAFGNNSLIPTKLPQRKSFF